MKRCIPWSMAVLTLLLALTATAAGAAGRGALLAGHGVNLALGEPLQQSTCTSMKADGDAYWLAVDESGEATDEVVDSYQGEVIALAAAFDYTCLPKGATIVTVFSYEGEVVFSDKSPQKPSNRAGSYSYAISRDDGEPMHEGEWEVAFFNNKTFLASSMVMVGGEGTEVINSAGDSDAVTVQGTIIDAKTKKPLKGVLVVVLNEGVKSQTFLKNPKDADIYTSATTDARGQFVMETPVERTAAHTWIVALKGYKPIIEDDLVVGADAEDPLELNIALQK
jgi:hypothetical protein